MLATQGITRVNVLTREIGVHWNAKKTLKWFAFSLLKFDISLVYLKVYNNNLAFFLISFLTIPLI